MTHATTLDDKMLKQKIEALLDVTCKEKRFDFSLKVTDVVRHEADWVYLVVTPDQDGVHSSQYADVLASVEAQLRFDEEIDQILLVPTLPEIP